MNSSTNNDAEDEDEDEDREDPEDEAREMELWWLQRGREEPVNRLLLQVAEGRANDIHIYSSILELAKRDREN